MSSEILCSLSDLISCQHLQLKQEGVFLSTYQTTFTVDMLLTETLQSMLIDLKPHCGKKIGKGTIVRAILLAFLTSSIEIPERAYIEEKGNIRLDEETTTIKVRMEVRWKKTVEIIAKNNTVGIGTCLRTIIKYCLAHPHILKSSDYDAATSNY